MALSFSEMIEEARLSARALLDYGDHFFNPTVRLGVTGLSRAGKTVFITAADSRSHPGRPFPIFEPFGHGTDRQGAASRRSPTTRCRASTMKIMSAP